MGYDHPSIMFFAMFISSIFGVKTDIVKQLAIRQKSSWRIGRLALSRKPGSICASQKSNELPVLGVGKAICILAVERDRFGGLSENGCSFLRNPQAASFPANPSTFNKAFADQFPDKDRHVRFSDKQDPRCLHLADARVRAHKSQRGQRRRAEAKSGFYGGYL